MRINRFLRNIIDSLLCSQIIKLSIFFYYCSIMIFLMDPVIVILCILGAIVLIFLIPLKGAGSFAYKPPSRRVHEEDAVLSRRLLKPGTKDYDL